MLQVLGMFDWLPYDPAAVGPMRTSRCTDSVNKAVKFGNTRINFVSFPELESGYREVCDRALFT